MRKRLGKNIAANVVQTVAGAALLFALYRYINSALGIEQLGVWSVVLATVSASRLGDLGLSAGVTRFVSRHRARSEPQQAGTVIDTAALTLMVAMGIALPIVYPALTHLLPHLFEAHHLAQAEEILPYALVSLWLTMVAAAFQGGLDGCMRMDLRATLVVLGQSLLLILAMWLVPQYSLVGLAWAQIGQGLFLLVIGRLFLRRALPELNGLPRRWSNRTLREMLGYGAKVQTATVFMLLFDPVAKALMARFGGPSAAGYFEMASQVVLKGRAVIVTANAAVVPHVAALAERDTALVSRLYQESMRVLIFVALPAFSLLIAWAGGISWLLVGSYQAEFVFFIVVLALAWGGNVFTGPAYFSNLGVGEVGWNTLAQVMMGTLNAGLGWLLGSWYGSHGVASAYVIALITGSGWLVLVFQIRHGIDWSHAFTREHVLLVLASAAVIVLSWIQPLRPSLSDPTSLAVSLILSPLILGVAVWIHPMRTEIGSWLATSQSTSR